MTINPLDIVFVIAVIMLIAFIVTIVDDDLGLEDDQFEDRPESYEDEDSE